VDARCWRGRVRHGYTAGWDFPHCTRICAVSHETRCITLTRGILIIKIMEIIIAITITITLQYLKRTGGGREYETAALSKKTK